MLLPQPLNNGSAKQPQAIQCRDRKDVHSPSARSGVCWLAVCLVGDRPDEQLVLLFLIARVGMGWDGIAMARIGGIGFLFL
jgi:hypothetical protein